jgi:hypothetical protein
MPNIELEYPNLLVVENLLDHGRKNLRANPKLVAQIQREAFQGVVDKNGKWGVTPQGELLCPGGGWAISKLGEGLYKVTHAQGYYNISLSTTLLQSPGTIVTLENHPEYFVVQTSINGKPYDMPFAFTLIRVISPSEPQKQITQNSFSPPSVPSVLP